MPNNGVRQSEPSSSNHASRKSATPAETVQDAQGQRPATITITLWIAGRVSNPLNGSHRHWSARAQWAQGWRYTTRLAWLEAGRPTLEGPCAFTFTAYVARRFDDDGIRSAVKPIRDEAVACICGGGDGPASGHQFFYTQERRADLRGVEIVVTPR
jgi:hypothetical protein